MGEVVDVHMEQSEIESSFALMPRFGARIFRNWGFVLIGRIWEQKIDANALKVSICCVVNLYIWYTYKGAL